ncbi:site-2 protease family protein [Streptomyces sp. AA1529]|uniref:site-2 protease family protein n=1 Tax=Streptomyces sp. AA1529 TaxID=1203257 RepID=UPI00030CAE88|nr:site-2 protease family protein [Streptomyces sp. AA1529]
MRATFPLGRIAGVRIGVHWSVLLIFALITWVLARSRFPQVEPGRAEALYWVTGLGTALLFFGSLLAHELAHAIVARRNGVLVEDITLWLLGGLARLKSEASEPGAELRIAGVGPLVSLLLGVGFGLGSWLVHLLGAPRLLVEAAAWLAVINVLLALFNTIPAAPLDGGRLLRALLWRRSGDRLRAAVRATLVGRAFGWLLVVGGVLLFLTARAFDGLWLALVGWFLVTAATAEGRQAQIRSTLAGVPVRRAMTGDPVLALAGLTIGQFLADPRYRYRHSAFPAVGAAGDAAGLITLERAQHVRADQRETTAVGDVMLPLSEVVTVGPDDPLADLLPRMEPGAEHRVLVLEDGQVVGIVSPSDIGRTLSWLMPQQQHPRTW